MDNQIEQNYLLEKEITQFTRQIKEINALKQEKAKLIAKMSTIQNIQATRTIVIHLLDELIKIVPSSMYIYKLERKARVITLWGYAKFTTDISVLMHRIEHNAWLQAPILTEIKKTDANTQANNEFSLRFILSPKNKVN